MAVVETENPIEKMAADIVVVCPECKGPLTEKDPDTKSCISCSTTFSRIGGFWDLIIGERFEDDSDEECLCYEEVSNEYTARNYWVPLFTELKGQIDRPLRILSLGCGTGVEVDILCEAGFNCVGIDCGNRPQAWENRAYPERLFLANGMNLPFEDGIFDIVFCGCVFPHVGVVGDSFVTTNHYFEDRSRLASEMARVATSTGQIALSSPNGSCPFDLFHGRKPGSYKPRLNPPNSRFLLRLKDYHALFQGQGYSIAKPLKVEGYWGFVRAKYSPKGLLLGMPIRFLFWLLSREPFAFLRTSPISPWLVVIIKK